MTNNRLITVNQIPISVSTINDDDYISLTDMARFKGEQTADIIKNWLRNKDTLLFLGIWEQINNPNFKLVEFDQFKQQSGSNAFVLSPTKWVEQTQAIGIRSKAGRYGGTYAHKDIAFEFGSWLSPEFKLYLIKEFQRLKEQEYNTQSIEWHANRELAKINYKLQTDAIQQNLLLEIDKSAHANIYATEADMLNMIIFGKTAKEHKQTGEKGNLRDTATPLQNAIVANLEFLNAMLITQGIEQSERYNMLKAQAEHMKTTLQNNPTIKKLT